MRCRAYHLLNQEADKMCQLHFQWADVWPMTMHMFLVAVGITNMLTIGIEYIENIALKRTYLLLFWLFFVQQTRSFMTTMLSDPGYVVKQQYRQQNLEKQERVAEILSELREKDRESWRARQEGLRHGEGQNTEAPVQEELPGDKEDDEGQPYAEYTEKTNSELLKNVKIKGYCKYCDYYKPDRAHHCKYCGRCVERYDHHCPFVMNCVGRNNFPYFFKFCMYAGITATLSALATCYGAFVRIRMRLLLPIGPVNLYTFIASVIRVTLGVVGSVFPLSMFVGTWRSVCEDMTTVEVKMYMNGIGDGKTREKTRCNQWLGRNWCAFLLLCFRARQV